MLIKTEPPDDQEYCHGKAGGCKFGGGGGRGEGVSWTC